MKFYLCIDDTDDTTKNVGTGQIASVIYNELKEAGSVMRYQITRHQLLLDPGIDYTSHNSSMCMEGDTKLSADRIWDMALECLLRMRSKISNPGICLYIPPEGAKDGLLREFGKKAQKKILTVEEALETACAVPGVRLEAPAGNGNGQIGALAGVGLRLGGNDGTFRGKVAFDGTVSCTVKEMKGRLGIGEIYALTGELLPDGAIVTASGAAKLIYRDSKAAAAGKLLPDGSYELCSKASVFEALTGLDRPQIEDCVHFVWDNDRGEQWSDQKGTCENCLHRTLTSEGMKCRYQYF